MAVVEGLANGIAVVTTRVGAHEEVITDGESGLFVPVGDPTALAQAIAGLLRDPVRRRRLAAAGRQAFVDRFSMTPYMERLERTYAAAAATMPAGSPVAGGEAA